MKTIKVFSTALLLVPLAACEPVEPAEPSSEASTPESALPTALETDAALHDASAAQAPAVDAARSTATAAQDASLAASPADAAARTDAQAPDAGDGCASRCPNDTPCQNHQKIVFPKPLCPAPPPSPPAMCTSTTGAITGYCGSYSCKQSQESFAAAFAASSKCGNARDFMCAGTLHGIAYQCMINNALSANAPADTAECIKADRSVATNQVGDACITCFVTAQECCKKNKDCLSTCLLGQGKECDDAQRAAGCLAPLFTCTGLPNPS